MADHGTSTVMLGQIVFGIEWGLTCNLGLVVHVERLYGASHHSG